MPLPEQIATSNPIAASPVITSTMNTTNTADYTVPVSQAFATIMADLNANQPLHFAIGSSSSPAVASPSVRRYKPKRLPSINEIEFRKMLKLLLATLSHGQINKISNSIPKSISTGGFLTLNGILCSQSIIFSMEITLDLIIAP
ncbi:hypothetical protein CsatA_023168 [Cannabis sativa]